MNINCQEFLRAYHAVYNSGQLVHARGLDCLEVQDYMLRLSAADSPLTSFAARSLNLQYAKQEMLWYLRADPKDDSITQYATMWQKLKQPDGTFYSNYGQYIFGGFAGHSQFSFVVNELRRDRDSRRASMVLLQRNHLFHENSDVVCTYGLNFRIRHNALHMTVMMRSNDLIFGTTNDVFCFWCIYHLVRAALLKYTSVEVGSYHHFVNSLHIYERHFPMVATILEEGASGYTKIHVPTPTPEEVWRLVDTRAAVVCGPFSEWLNAPVS